MSLAQANDEKACPQFQLLAVTLGCTTIDDLTPLTQSDRWLGWLGDEPELQMRQEIESMLKKQVPTATLAWVRLMGTPEFLTGARGSSRPSNSFPLLIGTDTKLTSCRLSRTITV